MKGTGLVAFRVSVRNEHGAGKLNVEERRRGEGMVSISALCVWLGMTGGLGSGKGLVPWCSYHES